MRARSTARGRMCGLTEADMRATGSRTGSRDTAHIHGSMADNTQVLGRIITCTGTESTHGATEGGMRVITKWTRSTATVSIDGQTVAGMKATGSTGNSMVKAGT